MSLRYLKFETEAENGMVDERGVLIPGGSTGGSTGSAGGYKYFGISGEFGSDAGMRVYKMDTYGVINNLLQADECESDVSKTEFENAYLSQPILLVPIHEYNGQAIERIDGFVGMEDNEVPRPVIFYKVSDGSPMVYTEKGSYTTTTTLEFAAE